MNFRKRVLPVHTYGSPVLKALAAPVMAVTPELRELAAQMIDTMFAFDGIGLAAPQVGVSVRMVTFALPRGRDESLSPGEAYLLPMMPMVIINPQVISCGNAHHIQEEGCLSVPEIYAPVDRPDTVVFQGRILDGPDFTVECGGLLARCVQHEIDHLDGKLFIQKTPPENFEQIRPEVEALLRMGQENNFMRLRP